MKSKRLVIIGVVTIVIILVSAMICNYFIGNNKSYSDYKDYHDITAIPDSTEVNDKVESNIEVESGYDSFDFTSVTLEYTENDTILCASVLSAIAYTLDKYYEGNIPCYYSFDSTIDTIEQKSNMLSTFRVNSCSSNYPTLIITIDFVNSDIYVTEE